MAFLSVVVVVTYGIMTIGRPLVNLVHSERSPLCWTRVLINNLIQLMDTVTSICVAGQIYHHGGITGPFAHGSHVTLKVSITYQLNKMGHFSQEIVLMMWMTQSSVIEAFPGFTEEAIQVRSALDITAVTQLYLLRS